MKANHTENDKQNKNQSLQMILGLQVFSVVVGWLGFLEMAAILVGMTTCGAIARKRSRGRPVWIKRGNIKLQAGQLELAVDSCY